MKITHNQHQKAALLKKMLARMDRMLRSNGFRALKVHQQRSFLHRLRRLTRQLRPDFSRMGLRPALLTALTTLGLGVMTQGKAQSFDSTQVLPFNVTALPAGEAKPTLVDIDGDGDLDLFAGSDDGDIYFAENIGTATAPSFDSLQVNPFSITPADYYSVPDLVDIDSDGDLDLFMGEGYPVSIRYCENIGTATVPLFDSLQTNPFGIAISVMYDYEAKPAMADLDGDGDIDLLIGTAYGAVLYYQNTGTATSPAFATQVSSPFGISSSGYYIESSFGDLDKDGDLDLGIYDDTGNFTYFQNTGTATAPAFAAGQTLPFGIQIGYSYSGATFMDLDGDQDLDMFKGVVSGEFWYQENLDTTATANQPPVIALGVTNDTTCAMDTLGPISFSASDVDSPNFSVIVSSTNQAVIADADITLSGSAPNYMFSAIPNGPGNTDIVVTAADSNSVVTDTISVFVDPCQMINQPPVITLTVTNDTTCANDTLGPIAFTAFDPDSPNFTVTVSSTNQSVIMDANITLMPGSASYFFTAIPSGPGNTNIVVTADDSTNTVTDTVSVFVDPCLIGIDDSFFAREFSVYPNPADRELAYRLDLLSPVARLDLELVDLNGRVILREHRSDLGTEFSGQMDVSELSAGIYFLRVRTDLYRLNQKVVIE